jgi:general secretion pathway protein D
MTYEAVSLRWWLAISASIGLLCVPLCLAQAFNPFAGSSTRPAAAAAAAEPSGGAARIGRFDPPPLEDPGPVFDEISFNDGDICELLQLISQRTKWSIFPSAKTRGKISIYAVSIPAAELLDRAVTMAGFVYVRQKSTVTVMSYEEYMQYYGVEKRVVKLSQRAADDVARALAQFVTPRGRLIADPSTRSVILYDTPTNIPLLERVIQEIDLPASQMAVEVIKLVYADVSALCQELALIYEQAKAEAPVPLPAPASSQPASGSTTILAASGRSIILCPIARTNHIVLKGYSQDLQPVRDLIEKLDVAPDFMESISYPITHLAAAELADSLCRAIGVDQQGAASTRSRGTAQSGRARSNASSSNAGDGNRIQVGVLTESNSIVVTAPGVVHQQVKAFLAACDVPPPQVAGGIQVYKLENATAKDVAQVLQQLVDQQDQQSEQGKIKLSSNGGDVPVTGPSRQTPSAPSSVSPPSAPPMAEGRAPLEGGDGSAAGRWVTKPRIVADESTNAVVIQASAQEQAQFGQLIKQLDRRRSQVLLEVVIVDIRGTEDIDVGAEWETYDAPGAHAGDLIFTSYGLSTLDPATGQRAVTVLPGGTAAVIRSDYVPVILHALQASGKGRIRTAPQLLVNDNSQGQIESIAEEPYKQVNTNNTVATTSFGGFVQAGTQLAVTPHISESDYLKLQYQIVLSAFRGRSTDASLPPARDTNSISSEAAVPDGDTLIVGGLTYKSKRESKDRVPLLGDIPLLGYLFSRTLTTEEDIRLYVFVTPRILRDEQFRDLRSISQRQRLESKESSSVPDNGPLDLPDEKG